MADARLSARYAGVVPEAVASPEGAVVDLLLAHRSVRAFRPDPLPPGLLELLIACAQSAPTKSDLQGMSVVALQSAESRAALCALVPEQAWMARAPLILVWCPDMRRNEEACRLRGREHRSNTLDTFLNVSVDTALAMQNFTVAAEALGLGACNVSVVRNRAREVSALLDLPRGVYPLAGMCVGYPAERGEVSPRLPQAAVLHWERYGLDALNDALDAYDRVRQVVQPYSPSKRLYTDRYDADPEYGWLEHTARRMERRERADFRKFIIGQGFGLA